MSVPDLQNLGGPAWFTLFGSGIVVGTLVTAAVYESMRVPSMLDREHAAERRAADAESQLQKSQAVLKESRDHANNLEAQLKSSASAASLADLKANHAQCVSNNQQLQTAYAKVFDSNGLQNQIDALTREYKELAAAVVHYTAGVCRNAKNPDVCDLIPMDQRTLQSMQAQRDQTHARLMQLQDKLACAKP